MLKEKLSNRGLTVVDVLVVLAIISVIVVFLIATLTRNTADEVACQSNLRELQKLAVIYADTVGKGFLPLAEGPNPSAYASISLLLKANDGLKPAMFICRTWRGGVAEVVDEKYALSEDTCSYTWISKPVSTKDKPTTPVSCDKFVHSDATPSGHKGGRNVVYLDGSVEFVTTEQIPADALPPGLTR